MKTTIYKIIIAIIFCGIVLPASSQIRKADKLYNNFEFARAITYYKRAAHGQNKADAMNKMANCYRQMKNYSKAEQLYAKLVMLTPNDPMVHFYYAESLLNNKKFDDAKKEYTAYASLKPDDKDSKKYLYACDEMKTWDSQPYELQSI